jgi:dephospho-CoA kinase
VTIIVITGGISSGKSFVLNYIKKLGYAVLYTDLIAKEVMQSDYFLTTLQQYLNSKYIDIKQEIINNPSLLPFIESIVHPEVENIRHKKIQNILSKTSEVFIEIPLFFEKNLQNTFMQYGKLIVVSTICGLNKQIIRAKKRDTNLTDEMLQIILSRQFNDRQRVAGSNIIIYTCKSKYNVKKTVQKLLKNLR